MTRARAQQICCQDTPYYHCISRVVRKAFLCGFAYMDNGKGRQQDAVAQIDPPSKTMNIDDSGYQIDQLKLMTSFVLIFVPMRSCRIIFILFYVPLKVSNKPEVDALTDLEVIKRWRKIYSGPDIIQRFLDGEALTKEHHVLIAETVESWRNRLEDISWFMRCLNEYIARKANFEDNCTGHLYSLPSLALRLRAS